MVLEEHGELVDLRIFQDNDRTVVDVWLESCIKKDALCHRKTNRLSVESCTARLNRKEGRPRTQRRVVPPAQLNVVCLPNTEIN